MWGEFRSNCNVNRGLYSKACLFLHCGWTADLCKLKMSCLCHVKPNLTAVVTAILVTVLLNCISLNVMLVIDECMFTQDTLRIA